MDGSFTALGYEDIHVTNPLYFVPAAGMLQLLILLLISTEGGPDFLFTNIPLIGDLFPISFLAFLISTVFEAVVVRHPRKPTSTLNVSYSDQRRTGGQLTLSYSIPGGKTRTSIAVRKVKGYPTKPLTRVAHTVEGRVAGTTSSMLVLFKKPRIFLALGFSSAEEMNEVYGLLR
ncbi:MAG: hypothetical protein JRN27_08220 [Nitrososphaerota archaeon]|nr:hypothetical protein [Nitrososphaerota archaeon]